MLNVDHFPILSTEHQDSISTHSSVATEGRFHKLASSLCDKTAEPKSIKITLL